MTLKSAFKGQKWPFWDTNMFFQKSKIFLSERQRITDLGGLVSTALGPFYYYFQNNSKNDPKISFLGSKMAVLGPKNVFSKIENIFI